MAIFIAPSIATGSLDTPEAGTTPPVPPVVALLEDGFGNVFEMTVGGDEWITT